MLLHYFDIVNYTSQEHSEVKAMCVKFPVKVALNKISPLQVALPYSEANYGIIE